MFILFNFLLIIFHSEPGASLIIIKGHRHLHECAYVGDDSSEESDELAQIERERLEKEAGNTPSPNSHREMLKKHRSEVSFERKEQAKLNSTFNRLQRQEHEDETPMRTAKEMRALLEKINEKRIFRANGTKVLSDTAEDEDAKQAQLHKHHKTFDNDHRHRTMEFGKAHAGNVEMGTVPGESQEHKKEEVVDDDVPESSREVLKALMKKMKKLGKRGERILRILEEETKDIDLEDNSSGVIMDVTKDNSTETEGNSTTTSNPEPTTTNKPPNPVDEEKIARVLRKRRALIMQTALSIELNSDDETENLALEEGFTPDGHADEHKVINETTLNDRSDSEIWSSFSSSEEALLECPGLIMSLPLTPSRKCVRGKGDQQLREEFSPNTITFT